MLSSIGSIKKANKPKSPTIRKERPWTFQDFTPLMIHVQKVSIGRELTNFKCEKTNKQTKKSTKTKNASQFPRQYILI